MSDWAVSLFLDWLTVSGQLATGYIKSEFFGFQNWEFRQTELLSWLTCKQFFNVRQTELSSWLTCKQ